jgi:hypothetical protein
MSKAKSKSKRKSVAAKPKPAPVSEVPVGDEAIDEMSAGEKFLISTKPYWAHIALGVLAVILASVLWTTWQGMQTESAAAQWQELNNAITQADLTRDPSSLKEMGEKFDGEAAGNWAWLMAADDEFNRGVSMLPNDRVGGFKLVKKAAESAQRVIDAPATSKTPEVQQRSLFLMAQIEETQGNFDAAKGHYQTLLDEAPECPFADAAKRGVERCSNPELAAFYEKFKSWEEVADVAPGELVPDAPKLNLDGLKLPEGEKDTFNPGGGDFDPAMKKEVTAAESETAVEKDDKAESENTEDTADKIDAKGEEKTDSSSSEEENSGAKKEETTDEDKKADSDAEKESDEGK